MNITHRGNNLTVTHLSLQQPAYVSFLGALLSLQQSRLVRLRLLSWRPPLRHSHLARLRLLPCRPSPLPPPHPSPFLTGCNMQ